MKTNIIIKTTFEAVHCWPDCTIQEVDFLQYPHRHVFHVTMKFPVQHNDRDIEFIREKRKVEDFLLTHWHRKNVGRMSCEDFCSALFRAWPNATYISVFEDNENGAEVYQ